MCARILSRRCVVFIDFQVHSNRGGYSFLSMPRAICPSRRKSRRRIRRQYPLAGSQAHRDHFPQARPPVSRSLLNNGWRAHSVTAKFTTRRASSIRRPIASACEGTSRPRCSAPSTTGRIRVLAEAHEPPGRLQAHARARRSRPGPALPTSGATRAPLRVTPTAAISAAANPCRRSTAAK